MSDQQARPCPVPLKSYFLKRERWGTGAPQEPCLASSRDLPRSLIGLAGEECSSVYATARKPFRRLRGAGVGVPLRLLYRRSVVWKRRKTLVDSCEDKGIIPNSRTGKGAPFGHRPSQLRHRPPGFAPWERTGVLSGTVGNLTRPSELSSYMRVGYVPSRCLARRHLPSPSHPARPHPHPLSGRRTAARGAGGRRRKTPPLDDPCAGALVCKHPET